MSSEKKQGKMLLDWAEMNFLEQYIHTPTRKDNILDLVFTDSPNLIRGYETVVSKRFTDHNILKIYLTPSSEKEKEVKRKNPYTNQVYEYDLINADEEDWKRYDVLLTELSEEFDFKTEKETTNERLISFYNLIEKVVRTLFEKKEAFKEENDKKVRKGNKIPKEIRIMMRKRTKISRKIYSSNSKVKILKILKTLENVEKELKCNYENMRTKREREALNKIKKKIQGIFIATQRGFQRQEIKLVLW